MFQYGWHQEQLQDATSKEQDFKDTSFDNYQKD